MFNRKFKYIPKNKRTYGKNNKFENKAGKFAHNLIKSEIDRYGTNLLIDYKKILDGGCIYIPNFFCSTSDRTIFNQLKKEIESNSECQLVQWSKHFKHENPDFSPMFNNIVEQMADHFNVDVYQTRLNFYKDNTSWKPFHHDSHAYGDKKEDFTMGASFGDTRELEFIHENSGNKFKFIQNNGDIFAFNKEINKKFMHGVPKTNRRVGSRFSIIVWGKKIVKN